MVTTTIYFEPKDEEYFLKAVDIWNSLPDGVVCKINRRIDRFKYAIGYSVTCQPEDLYYIGVIQSNLKGGAKC